MTSHTEYLTIRIFNNNERYYILVWYDAFHTQICQNKVLLADILAKFVE